MAVGYVKKPHLSRNSNCKKVVITFHEIPFRYRCWSNRVQQTKTFFWTYSSDTENSEIAGQQLEWLRVPAERLDETFGDRLGDCDHGWQRAWGSERQTSRCSHCHCQLERRPSQAKAINLKKGTVGADARKGKRSINSAAAGKSSFLGTPTDLRRCDQSPISRLGVLNS